MKGSVCFPSCVNLRKIETTDGPRDRLATNIEPTCFALVLKGNKCMSSAPC